MPIRGHVILHWSKLQAATGTISWPRGKVIPGLDRLDCRWAFHSFHFYDPGGIKQWATVKPLAELGPQDFRNHKQVSGCSCSVLRSVAVFQSKVSH